MTGESDELLPAGAAEQQVRLMQQLYRSPTGIGQCQPCRGTGRITSRGGQTSLCPHCKGRGRLT